jgi:hypothetical protein
MKINIVVRKHILLGLLFGSMQEEVSTCARLGIQSCQCHGYIGKKIHIAALPFY